MAFPVPRQIGDLSLRVAEHDAVRASGSGSIGRWQDLLIPLGKEPSDVRSALGESGEDDLVLDGLVIQALRVDGVPAESLLEPYLWGVMVGARPDELPGGLSAEWQDIGSQRVFVLAEQGSEGWGMFLYPVGEVLFVVGTVGPDSPELTIEEVLAELP